MNMNSNLSFYGFNFGRNSVHTARTIMLAELKGLLDYVNNPEAEKTEYLRAIDEENCLGKRSGKTRLLTYRHLSELYGLDPALTLFRSLLFFWYRDPDGQSLLALLCAYARDSLLRATVPFIQKFTPGASVTREALEAYIDDLEPGRFSPATLKSTAQNINSSWTKSGHLRGRKHKVRSIAMATVGSVSYALLLGYLAGIRGQSLFSSEYIKLLDCTSGHALELAEEASRSSWITCKRIDEVVEVLFPNVINPQEMERLHEQG